MKKTQIGNLFSTLRETIEQDLKKNDTSFSQNFNAITKPNPALELNFPYALNGNFSFVPVRLGTLTIKAQKKEAYMNKSVKDHLVKLYKECVSLYKKVFKDCDYTLKTEFGETDKDLTFKLYI